MQQKLTNDWQLVVVAVVVGVLKMEEVNRFRICFGNKACRTC